MTKISLVLLGVTLPLGVFWGGVAWVYYGFILNVFTVLGVTAVIMLLTKFGKWNIKQSVLLPTMIFIGALVCLLGSNNTYLLKYEKEDLPQYKFATIIQQTESPTILNYNFLDGGFYTAAGVVPTGKYFCLLNIPLEEMRQSLDNEVAQGKVDYVVTKDKIFSFEYYKMIEKAEFYYEGKVSTYYLYKHNTLITNN